MKPFSEHVVNYKRSEVTIVLQKHAIMKKKELPEKCLINQWGILLRGIWKCLGKGGSAETWSKSFINKPYKLYMGFEPSAWNRLNCCCLKHHLHSNLQEVKKETDVE